jgi:hypothetical protein
LLPFARFTDHARYDFIAMPVPPLHAVSFALQRTLHATMVRSMLNDARKQFQIVTERIYQ